MVDQNPQSDPAGHVVPFRHRRSDELLEPEDLAKFEGGGEPDDYRHRMVMNVAGLAVVVLLIAVGLWIADTMAAMRKNQDCVLSGRRGCTPVEVSHDRW